MARKRRVYEVLVIASKLYLVDASCKEEALELVSDEAGPFTRDFDIDEIKIHEELKDDKSISASLRHGAEDIREHK